MFPQKSQISAKVDSETYPLGEKNERADGPARAMVALSHTQVERRLYASMLLALDSVGNG